MDCPECKDKDAYVGFTGVECLNPECRHFSEHHLITKLEEQQQAFDHLIDALDIRNEWDEVLEQMWLGIITGTLGRSQEITTSPGDTNKCTTDS